MLTLKRRPAAPTIPPDDDSPPPIATGTHQAGSALAARATTALLVIVLLAAPVGAAFGVMAWLRPAPDLSTVAPPPDLSSERAAAAEFAQRALIAWLTSTTDNDDELRALTGTGAAPGATKAFTVTDPAVAAISSPDPQVWSVQIAATVTDAKGRTSRRYYQVPVAATATGLAVASLPAPVPAPPVAPAPRLDYPASVPLTSELATGLGQFLEAFLTGGDDVARYLTPDIALSPISPAPYRVVKLTDLQASAEVPDIPAPRSTQSVKVLAAVRADVTAAQSVDLAYALTLTARDGRWEITTIDPAPSLDAAALDAAAPEST